MPSSNVSIDEKKNEQRSMQQSSSLMLFLLSWEHDFSTSVHDVRYKYSVAAALCSNQSDGKVRFRDLLVDFSRGGELHLRKKYLSRCKKRLSFNPGIRRISWPVFYHSDL